MSYFLYLPWFICKWIFSWRIGLSQSCMHPSLFISDTMFLLYTTCLDIWSCILPSCLNLCEDAPFFTHTTRGWGSVIGLVQLKESGEKLLLPEEEDYMSSLWTNSLVEFAPRIMGIYFHPISFCSWYNIISDSLFLFILRARIPLLSAVLIYTEGCTTGNK